MRLLLPIFIIFASSCSDEKLFEPKYEVPEEYEHIVDRFIKEAGLRNQFIEINNLIIRNDENLDACGRCNTNSIQENVQKVITINPISFCWSSKLRKETLLFHELGHCILGRGHNNQFLPNGDPKSLMVDNNTTLYTGCIYQFGEEDDCNNTFKREYYLDELFDENTPTPDWAK